MTSYTKRELDETARAMLREERASAKRLGNGWQWFLQHPDTWRVVLTENHSDCHLEVNLEGRNTRTGERQERFVCCAI